MAELHQQASQVRKRTSKNGPAFFVAKLRKGHAKVLNPGATCEFQHALCISA
jgi:hypothetical protein